MIEQSRIEVLLSPARRDELRALAQEAGVSTADVVRLSISWILQNPGVPLGGDRPADRAA